MELAAMSLHGEVRYAGRVVRFATSGNGGKLCLVFPPLGVSRLLVTRPDVIASARASGLRLICIDRPGIGGTSPVQDETWMSSAHQRVTVHSDDISAVLTFLGERCERAIAICAGAPFLVHHLQQPNSIKHVTLVTPWVSPECVDALPLARAPQWILGRAFAAFAAAWAICLLLSFFLSLSPKKATAAIARKLTESERCEYHKTGDLSLLGDTATHFEQHSLPAMRDDVAVLLANYDEIGAKQSETEVVIFAADRDDLVKPKAVVWFVKRLFPNATLYFVHQASHLGLQTLRRDLWLQATAGHHITEHAPPPGFLDTVLDDSDKKLLQAAEA